MTDVETYDPRFFDRLSEMEKSHFWYVSRRRVVAAALETVVAPLPDGFRVLEVGCGAGGMLEVLRTASGRGRVFGLDLHVEGLRFARRRTEVPVVAGDLSRAPFSSPFDVVALFDVLEHFDDDVAVLRDLSRLVAPSGTLVVTVPASPSLWSYFDEAARHRRRYTRAALASKLSDAGFDPLNVTPFLAAYFPLVYLHRRLSPLSRKRSSAHERTREDLVAPGLVNRPLTLLSAFEPLLVRRRARLPFGTSILALATKSAGGTSPA